MRKYRDKELNSFIESNFKRQKTKLLKILSVYKRVGYFEKFEHLGINDVLTDVLCDLRVKVVADD